MTVERRFGQRLAGLRAEKGFTQEEMAQQAGVTHRAYQRWERGEATPYRRNQVKLAGALGLTVEELLGQAATTPDRLDVLERLDRMEASLARIEAQLSPEALERLIRDELLPPAENGDDTGSGSRPT